jgi:hypothetical protein
MESVTNVSESIPTNNVVWYRIYFEDGSSKFLRVKSVLLRDCKVSNPGSLLSINTKLPKFPQQDQPASHRTSHCTMPWASWIQSMLYIVQTNFNVIFQTTFILTNWCIRFEFTDNSKVVDGISFLYCVEQNRCLKMVKGNEIKKKTHTG